MAASFKTSTLFIIIAKNTTKMQVQTNVDEADLGNAHKSDKKLKPGITAILLFT
ncbi:hypothetical protein FLA_3691 [Filimonas lacunae]|nr:hypothetical protein FLA_3691 [Filimonas lacunae]